MAGKSNTSATYFAQKKLLGKAHTSNLKTDGEELIGSNIQAASSQIFGQKIPENPAQTLYLLQSASLGAPATVEYIHFALTALTGTTYDANESSPDGGSGSDSGESSQSSGVHTYKFVFQSDYESNSSNPKEGNGNFNNNRIIHETLGKVQLVPPFFSQNAPNPYIIKIYKDNGSGGIGDEIPLLDNIDWNVDYYNGVLFLQDYNASKIPAHAKAFAYVGDFADQGFFESTLSGSLTKLTDGTSYLVAGSNVTITSASNGQVTIASSGGGGGGSVAGSDTQVQFNDGGSFGGDSGLVFNKTTNTLTVNNLTGSLTKISDGSSYLLAGSGITIATASNGSITITNDGTVGDITSVSAGTGLIGGGSNGGVTLAVNDSIVATLTGSTFTGPVHFSGSVSDFIATGSVKFNSGLSGSLQNLTNGTSYLVAGSNIAITSASNGQVTIAGTDTTYTAGDGLDLSTTTFSLDLKSGGGLKIDSTELSIEPNDFAGTGLMDDGSDNLKINDSIVATISGSGFKGHVGVTGSLYSTTTISGSLLKGNYLTGSLTKLANGTSYLVAGSNVTITSGSTGQVTIASTDTNTTYTAGDGLDLSTTTFSLDLKSGGGLKIDSTELSIEPNDFAGTGLMDDGSDNLKINDSIVATISGSGFKGHVGVTGSLYSTTTISGSLLKGNYLTGSLTQLTDGSSYLVAGDNVTITSASNGQVTISSTGGGGGSSSSSFFNETSSGFINTTGSLSIAGGEGESHVTSNVGSDTFFFVSGSLDDDNKSVFGGDVVISGSITSNKMSGSLTQLTDGSSYLVAGDNITITTASNGQITIVSTATGGGGSAGPRTKKIYNVDTSITSGSIFNTSAVSYEDSGYNPSLIDVFLNGQLLLSGTNSQVGLGEVDYFVHSKNQLKFGFDLQTDDVVNVVVSATGSAEAGNPGGTNTQVQFNDGGSLNGDSGLVFNKTTNTLTTDNISGSLTKLSDGSSYMISGNSISITSQSNGSILISAPNSIFNEYIGEANGSNTRFTLAKTPTENKNISIFVNGQLQMPATNITGAPFQDFSVTGSVIHFVTASLPPEGSFLMANYTTNQSIS